MIVVDKLLEMYKETRLSHLKPIVKFIAIPALIFYAISFIILRSSGFETMEILRDTAQLTEESSFLGFLSNVGIWLWISSVAICFFVAISNKGISKDHRELLILSGLLSLILAVDDFFMIHDRYVNEYICYLVYALCVVLLLYKYEKEIKKIEPLGFLLMGFFLLGSIGTDAVQMFLPLEYSTTQIFEEFFKFLGASIWLYFNYRVGSFKEITKS